jgi:hypothetical protein
VVLCLRTPLLFVASRGQRFRCGACSALRDLPLTPNDLAFSHGIQVSSSSFAIRQGIPQVTLQFE